MGKDQAASSLVRDGTEKSWDGTGQDQDGSSLLWDGTKNFFVGWDGTKSLWDGSSRSHAKPGPGPGRDKALVGWELPSWSHGQPKKDEEPAGRENETDVDID